MVRKIHFVFLFFLCGLILFAVSQSRQKSISELQKEYGEADAFYKKGLKAGSSRLADEKEEERLNQVSLEKFRAFLKNFSATSQSSDSLEFLALLKAGELYHYFDSLPEALRSYQAAIALKSHLPSFPDSFL